MMRSRGALFKIFELRTTSTTDQRHFLSVAVMFPNVASMEEALAYKKI